MPGTIHMLCRSKSVTCSQTGQASRPRLRSRISNSAGRKWVQITASGLTRRTSCSRARAFRRSMPRRSRWVVALCGVLSAFWCSHDHSSGARLTSCRYQSV